MGAAWPVVLVSCSGTGQQWLRPPSAQSPTPNGLTLVSELEPEPVLRVVAVEADERLVRGAQQGRRGVLAAELPDRGARGVRPVLNFKVVVIGFGRKVQKLNVCACGRTRRRNESQPHHAHTRACHSD